MNKRISASIAVASMVAAGAVALAAAGRSVLYQGAVVSTEIRIVNGRPYVPLADMARSLGGRVTPRGTGYEIVAVSSGGTAPGGANQVQGQNGKVGDWLFNGYWRFQVQSVEHVDQYPYRFSANTGTARPNGNNDELVVVTCQIKNGHKQTEEPILTANGTGVQKTALADDQGQSYAPVTFDVRSGGLAPGASRTFAVIFSVPKGTHLKSLIFTLYGFGVTSTKASNVRVALGP